MLQNNINMGQNSIELLSGTWYNDFDEWGKVCRKRANVVFVAIFVPYLTMMRSQLLQNNFHYIAADKGVGTRQEHVNAPLFRKQFRCDGLPEQAVLRVACVGLYRLYVNGTEVTKGHLAPYISNYNDAVYYDEYDVASMLLTGVDNVVCAVLGTGFADAVDFDVWQFESSPFRRAPCFALTLACDGKLTLKTDTSFEVYDSAITFDDIRAGERYDARLYRAELFEPSNKPLPGCGKPIVV